MPPGFAARPSRPAHEEKDRARHCEDETACGKGVEPRRVEPLVLGPIHDVEAPEEVVQPPRSCPDRREPSRVGRYIDAGGVIIGERDTPSWQRPAILGAGSFDPLDGGRRHTNPPIRLLSDRPGYPGIQWWKWCSRASVQQTDVTIHKLCLDDRSPEQHAVLKLSDRRSGRREQGGQRCEALCARQRRLGVPFDPVIAMHGVDGEQAHHKAAGEPDDRLRADQKSKPTVDLARSEVEAKAGAQNQVLTPATKLKPPVSSPRAREKRAVSPNCRSHDTPI